VSDFDICCVFFFGFDIAFSVLTSNELAIILQIMEVLSLEEEEEEESPEERNGIGLNMDIGLNVDVVGGRW